MATARVGVKTAVANRYTSKEMRARTKTEEDRRAKLSGATVGGRWGGGGG